MAKSVSVSVSTEGTPLVEPNNGFQEQTPEGGKVSRVVLDPSKETPSSEQPQGAKPAEGEQLLAGKFKSQDELVKAYKELESKLGAPKPETPAPTPNETITASGLDMNEFVKEAAEKGALSDDSYQKLAAKGIDKATADSYIAGQKALAEQHQNALLNRVGGRDAFDKMAAWARANLSKEDIAAIDKSLASGDTATAGLALDALQAKYTTATGSPPKLLTSGVEQLGTPGVKPFADAHELNAAFADPRYNTSEAYRKSVAERLMASDNSLLQVRSF